MAKAPAKGSKKKSFKKKEKKNVPVGLVHVQATFNNTIITITDLIGNVLRTLPIRCMVKCDLQKLLHPNSFVALQPNDGGLWANGVS